VGEGEPHREIQEATPDRDPAERSAVLVIRLWAEGDQPGGLRARLIQVLDARSREQTVATATSVDDICAAVRAWVEAFAASG
jgi:hypothetical protein